MRKWPRSSILFAGALVLASTAVHAIVLIPSSQYHMALRPTFGIMTLESVALLQVSMEKILMQTTQDIHRESIQPKAVNVVIQAHYLGSTKDIAVTAGSSFDLPTTVVTFAVLGNFDQVTSLTGTAFMDAFVSQTFTRAIFKDIFITSLKNSSDRALMHVIDASIDKLDSNSQMINPVGEEPGSSDKNDGLTAVDISLIAVSSMIFIAIVFVVIQSSRDKKTKQLPRSSSSRGKKKKYRSPAVKEKLSGVPSFDESMTSSQVAHLQFVPDTSSSDTALPEQCLDPHFRILRHSPPTTPTKTVISVIDEEEGNFSPTTKQEKESTTVSSLPSSMASGAPGAVLSSGDSSSASDASSASGRLPASLGSLSGHFSSSKYFEGSENSFSVDSYDVFGIGLENRKPSPYDDGASKSHCSTISSANSTSLVEWARTIRVIPSDNSSSVATPASAPARHDFLNHDSDSGDSTDGFATI